MAEEQRAEPAAAKGAPIVGGVAIGRYELCSELASGGMGRVYLARARGPAGFEKLVALKSIHPDLSNDTSFVDMFFDEARIAARIDHPNVCGVFDFGEADGRYFIAMEFLVGETVSRLLKTVAQHMKRDGLNATPVRDVLLARIVADAAEGLHAAHELKDEYGRPLDVVHRDVSPQNLFVGYDGSVKVVDFGIASAQGRLHRTTTGSVKGKLSYMAPEQFRREPVDRQVDLWALGVVLWELLTMQRLFKAPTEIDLILAVLNDPVRRPTEVRPDLDPDLEAIVMKALEKDRSARYGTAREIAQALNRWIVARGEVVGMPELAELMAETFPKEREATLALVDQARRMESTTGPFAAVSNDEAPTIQTGDIADVTRSRRRSELDVPAVSTSSPRWPLAAAAALVVAVGIGAWAAFGSAEQPTVADAPATSLNAPAVPSAAVAPAEASEPVVEAAAVEAAAVEAAAVEAAVEAARVEPEARPRTRVTTRRATERAETPATGTLRVETPGGWADVYVDGRRLGRTPFDGSLPSGRASLELRPFGLAPMAGDRSMRRTIQVGARPVRVVVPLGG